MTVRLGLEARLFYIHMSLFNLTPYLPTTFDETGCDGDVATLTLLFQRCSKQKCTIQLQRTCIRAERSWCRLTRLPSRIPINFHGPLHRYKGFGWLSMGWFEKPFLQFIKEKGPTGWFHTVSTFGANEAWLQWLVQPFPAGRQAGCFENTTPLWQCPNTN